MPFSPQLHPSQHDNAFTLVEVLIVMIILSMMIGIGIFGLSSTRKSSNSTNAMSAATAYVDAIDQFRLAHGGRVPQMGSADWPTSSAKARNAGPINAGNGKKAYLKTLPESVDQGTVVIAPYGSGITGNSNSARVLYGVIGTSSNTSQYALIVQKRQSKKLVDNCYFTNTKNNVGKLTKAPPC